MKRLPKWGSYRRTIRENWDESSLYMLRQDEIDREIKRMGKRPHASGLAKIKKPKETY